MSPERSSQIKVSVSATKPKCISAEETSERNYTGMYLAMCDCASGKKICWGKGVIKYINIMHFEFK